MFSREVCEIFKNTYFEEDLSANSCFCSFFLVASLFTSQIYQLKIECKGGASYFYKSKIITLGNRKKCFQLIHFRKSTKFSYLYFFRKCLMFHWSIPLRHYYISALKECFKQDTATSWFVLFLVAFTAADIISKNFWELYSF